MNKILRHIFIWLGYLAILISFISSRLPLESAILQGLIIASVHYLIFELNYSILLPKLFENKKYALYTVTVLVIVLLSTSVLKYFETLFIEDLLGYKRAGRPELMGDGTPMRKGVNAPDIFMKRAFHQGRIIMNIFSSVGVLFVSTIYRNIVEKNKREKDKVELKNKVLEAETKMLKSQINPHFLFNAMNNIYSLAQMKSDKTPEAIHQLSGMLRYVIYESDDKFVNLGEEIVYIKNFIKLHFLKDDAISNNVKVEIDNVDSSLRIAPMLLIPFIENSFKHSKIEDIENGWINLKIETKGNVLDLYVSNSLPEQNFSKDGVGGVGLENVKQRLQLLYPDNYTLKIDDSNNEYNVKLTISLNMDEPYENI